MGNIVSVRCPHCGYSEEALFGVGGQVGMLGEYIITVTCSKNARLVDTDAGSLFDPEKLVRYRNNEPHPGRCPLRTCRSRTHITWDPASATCPACGEPGCVIGDTGLWD
jgi:hypothetical protein